MNVTIRVQGIHYAPTKYRKWPEVTGIQAVTVLKEVSMLAREYKHDVVVVVSRQGRDAEVYRFFGVPALPAPCTKHSHGYHGDLGSCTRSECQKRALARVRYRSGPDFAAIAGGIIDP